jgi:hypothetical protein
MSSDSIVKGIIVDIIKTAVKTAEVDEQKTKRKHEKVIGERQTFGTPPMYTLSPSKSIKRSKYGEFLKDKNVLLMYTTVLSAYMYKYTPNLESLLTQQYVCVIRKKNVF